MPRLTYADQQLIESVGPLGLWLDFSESQLYDTITTSSGLFTSAVTVKDRNLSNSFYRTPNNNVSGVDGSSTVPFNRTFSAFESAATSADAYYSPGATVASTPRIPSANQLIDLFNWSYNVCWFHPSSASTAGRVWLFAGHYLGATAFGRANCVPRDSAPYVDTFQEGSAGAYLQRFSNGTYRVVLTDSHFNGAFRGSTGRDNQIAFSTFTAPSAEPLVVGLNSRVVQFDPVAVGTNQASTIVQEVELYVNGLLVETARLTYDACAFANGGFSTSSLTAVNAADQNLFLNSAATNPFTYAGYYIYSFGAGRTDTGTAVAGFGAVGEIVTYRDWVDPSLMFQLSDYFRYRWAARNKAVFGTPSYTTPIASTIYSFVISITNAEFVTVFDLYGNALAASVTVDESGINMKRIEIQADPKIGRHGYALVATNLDGYYTGDISLTYWSTVAGTLDPISAVLDQTDVAVWLDPSDWSTITANGPNVSAVREKTRWLNWIVDSPFQLTQDNATFLASGLRFAQADLGVIQPTRIKPNVAGVEPVFYVKNKGRYVAEYTGYQTQFGSKQSTVFMVVRHDKDSAYGQNAQLHLTKQPLINSENIIANGGVGLSSIANQPLLSAELRLMAKNVSDAQTSGVYYDNVGYDQNTLLTFESSGLGSRIRTNKTPRQPKYFLNQANRSLLMLRFESTSTYNPPYATADLNDANLLFSADPARPAHLQRTAGKFSPVGFQGGSRLRPLSGKDPKLATGQMDFYVQFWATSSALSDSSATSPVLNTLFEICDDFSDTGCSVLRVTMDNTVSSARQFTLWVGANSATMEGSLHPTVVAGGSGYLFFTIYRYTVENVSYFNMAINGVLGTPIQSSAIMTSSRLSLCGAYGRHLHSVMQAAYSDLRMGLGTLADYSQIPTGAFDLESPALIEQPLDNIGGLYSAAGYVPGPIGEIIVIPKLLNAEQISILENALYEKWIEAPAGPITISDISANQVDIGRRFTATVTIDNASSAVISSTIIASDGGNWSIQPTTPNGQGAWTISGSAPLTPGDFTVDVLSNIGETTANRSFVITAVSRTLPVMGQLQPTHAKASTSTTPTVFQGNIAVTSGVYDYTKNLNSLIPGAPAQAWTALKEGSGEVAIQGNMPQSLSAFEIKIDIE